MEIEKIFSGQRSLLRCAAKVPAFLYKLKPILTLILQRSYGTA